MQPGVVAGHFRGGRTGEVKYLIDGVESGIGLNIDAVQEIEVISGTFNAEYGKVMSGIVNMAPKEGGSELTGGVKLFTGNWLTKHDYVGLDKADVFHKTELRYNLSGPLPFTGNKVTFFIYLIYPSTVVQIPLMTDQKKSPKLQFLDTGLVNYFVGLQP
ncbi:MAG: hypothetical protein GWP06_13125 [Actinobacteria bacterium]|nr:hypothetical protein [Actinomycetota bacterium]